MLRKRISNISSVKIYELFDKKFPRQIKTSLSSILYLISPTLLLAHVQNEKLNPSDRRKSIISRNYGYLTISIIYIVFVGFLPPGVLGRGVTDFDYAWKIIIIISFYSLIWSRCNEILIAFIKDALEKAKGKDSKSDLSNAERMKLALLSYI